MKVRIKFKKYGALRFIGHLDVMRYFQKVIRRAEIPIAYTTGYSPHMIMSFASPLGIGLTSDGEYMDIELAEPIQSAEAIRRMNAVSVEGIEVVSFREISAEKKDTGMAIVAGADYLVGLRKGVFPDNLNELTEQFMAQPDITVLKQTKRSEKMVDIRPMIYEMCVREYNTTDPESQKTQIYMKLAAGSAENLKPDLVMSAFFRFAGIAEEEFTCTYHRLEMYANKDAEGDFRNLVSLESLGTDIL